MKHSNVFAQGRSGAMRASLRRFGASLRMMIAAVVLACSISFALRAGAKQTTTIWLYNSQHVLQDETAYYGYQNGGIFSLATNEVIGTVPDPNTGIILDSNNNDIGEVSEDAG